MGRISTSTTEQHEDRVLYYNPDCSLWSGTGLWWSITWFGRRTETSVWIDSWFGLGDSLGIDRFLPRQRVRQTYPTPETTEVKPVIVRQIDQNVDEDIVQTPESSKDPVTNMSTTLPSEPIDPIVDKVIAFLDEFFSSESGAPVTNKTGLQLDDLAPVDSISSDSVVHEVVHAAPVIDSKISPGMSGSFQNTRVLKNRVAPVISESIRSASVLDNKSSLRQSGSVRKVRVPKQRISPRLGNS